MSLPRATSCIQDSVYIVDMDHMAQGAFVCKYPLVTINMMSILSHMTVEFN
jgi:hypothetical protein